MTTRKARSKPGARSDSRVLFLRGFLERPREVGSVIPSSRFLERRIIRCADLRQAQMIVELGPGTGGTTRALLRAMRPDARLLAIEINPRFVSQIRRTLSDRRLTVEVGDAERIGEILAAHGLPRPDVVFSGIPFSTLPHRTGLRVMRAIHSTLAPGGRFVAYQVRDRVETLGRSVFGPAQVQTEILNVPPMRVYRWDRGGDSARSAPV